MNICDNIDLPNNVAPSAVGNSQGFSEKSYPYAPSVCPFPFPEPSSPSESYQTKKARAPHTHTDSAAPRRAPNEREKGALTDWLHHTPTSSEITCLSEKVERTRRQTVREELPGCINNQISSFDLFIELKNVITELNYNSADMFKPVESVESIIENESLNKCNLTKNVPIIEAIKPVDAKAKGNDDRATIHESRTPMAVCLLLFWRASFAAAGPPPPVDLPQVCGPFAARRWRPALGP